MDIPNDMRVLTSVVSKAPQSGPRGGWAEPLRSECDAPSWSIWRVSGTRGRGEAVVTQSSLALDGAAQPVPTITHRTLYVFWHSGLKGGPAQCQDREPEGLRRNTQESPRCCSWEVLP